MHDERSWAFCAATPHCGACIARPGVLVLVCQDASYGWIVSALVFAFLSDVFDGVIARRYGLVTARLRSADSRADIWYFAWISAAVCLRQPQIVHNTLVPLLSLLALQCLSYLLAWIRYGRIASYHAYTAKIWGLTLFLAAIALLTSHHGLPFLWFAIGAGLLSNLEGLAITLMLPVWTYDVSGLAHAWRLRRQWENTGG